MWSLDTQLLEKKTLIYVTNLIKIVTWRQITFLGKQQNMIKSNLFPHFQILMEMGTEMCL